MHETSSVMARITIDLPDDAYEILGKQSKVESKTRTAILADALRFRYVIQPHMISVENLNARLDNHEDRIINLEKN